MLGADGCHGAGGPTGGLRTTAWHNAVTLSSMFFMCSHMSPTFRAALPLHMGSVGLALATTPGDPCNSWGTKQPPGSPFCGVCDYGFGTGFLHRIYGTRTIRSASRNMASAYAAPQVVSDYLQADVTLDRFLGPPVPLPWTGWSSVSFE